MILLPENTYERESTEMLTVTVRQNNTLLTDNVFLSVIDSDLRPEDPDWVPAVVTADNKCGILLDNLAVGTYSVWVKIVHVPEQAVMRAGTVRII